LAAIGASVTAKRLALAYVLFKVGAAAIALVLFPVVIPQLYRASHSIDGVTLLAAYHTAYNVVGVAVFLPITASFTRLVERILPDRGSPLTRDLDPSALETPVAAVAAVRNTVAHALSALCDTIGTALQSALQGDRLRPAKDNIPIVAVSAALQQARDFISGSMSSPLDTKEERRLLTDTLQALDHASRLADLASDATSMETVSAVPREVGAAQFCVEAMKNASLIADEIGAPPASHGHDAPHHTPEFAIPASPNATPAVPAKIAIAELERCTQALDELQRTYRSTTLKAAANRELAAGEAMARVDGVRRLAALAGYAFRSAAHLVGWAANHNLPDAIPF
jgi:phosphate:Na+ symporter